MKTMKRFLAGILCAASLAAAPALSAGQEYILVGGTRAVIEGGQLILIHANSQRTVARPGKYDIRESNRAIYVSKEKIEVRERPPEIR